MILLKVIFQILVMYQMTQIISESKLTKPLRDYLLSRSRTSKVAWFFYELSSCFLCTSVWVGFLLTLPLFDLAAYMGYTTMSWFWNGLFFSCLTWYLHLLENRITS